MGKQAVNKYKAESGIWSKFNDAQKQMYNEMYSVLLDQSLYMHPKGLVNKKEHWKTTVHNAACQAAWALTQIKIA